MVCELALWETERARRREGREDHNKRGSSRGKLLLFGVFDNPGGFFTKTGWKKHSVSVGYYSGGKPHSVLHLTDAYLPTYLTS